MAGQPPHLALARTIEDLAGRPHALAFVIAEDGATLTVQAEADAIGDAVLAAVHGATA